MLAIENRELQDECSLGELFLYFSDELSNITWIQAFQLMLQMFKKLFSYNFELTEEKLSELVNAFIKMLPNPLKEQLKIA